MKSRLRNFTVLLCVMAAFLVACGGGGLSSVETLRLEPASATLDVGEQQEFTATVVGGGDSGVRWSVTGGSVTGDGSVVVYQPPDTPGEYTLTAHSLADPNKLATASIRVLPAPLQDETNTIGRGGGEATFEIDEPWVRFLPEALGNDTRVRMRTYDHDLTIGDSHATPIGLAAVIELDTSAINLEGDSEIHIAIPNNKSTDDFTAALVILEFDAGERHKFMANYHPGVEDIVILYTHQLKTIFESYGTPSSRLRIEVQPTKIAPIDGTGVGSESIGTQSARLQEGLFKFNFPFDEPVADIPIVKLDVVARIRCESSSEISSWDGWRVASSRDVNRGKTPLILVHGWMALHNAQEKKESYSPGLCDWIDYISLLSRDTDILAKYDVYSFAYDSTQRVVLSAHQLRDSIRDVFGDQEVVLLGHSMGGMVANHYIQLSGGAPNTEHLITLGTPYRGSRFVICEATQGDFCNGVRAAGGITDWVYSEVFQFGGTKDLAWEFSGVVYVTQTSNACIYSPLGCVTLGISRSNPYLEHVNSDLGSGDYSNYTAFVGTRRDGKTYAVPGAAIRLDGYVNDGIVAKQSACLSAAKNVDNACASSVVGDWVEVAYNHSDIKSGATFDAVKRVLLGVAPDPADAPAAFTLDAVTPYCTATLQPAIRLNWTASAGAIGYEIYRDGEFFVGNLTTQTSFDNDANVTPGATYSYFVRAVNSIGTTDSNTQTVTAAVEGCEVEPVEGADLVITELTVTPNAAEPGSAVTLTFNVTNQGDAPSAASVTRIRITDDATDVTTSDPLLAELNTPPLPATESLAYTQLVTLPAELVDGDYFLWVIADVFNNGEQSNYDNDRASTPLRVRTPFEACTAGDPNDAFNPCELTSVEQLQAISANLAGNYALGGSINATATATWNAGSGFEPIGSQDRPFNGTLDGRGYEVVGLTINREDTELVGLFAVVGSAGLIRDINLVGGTISGLGPVGAVAGLNHGTLQDIQQSNSINGQDRVGGLVGLNTGQISGATNFAAVEGSDLVGGIVGHNQAGGIVTGAQNAGSTQGETYVGGVVGLSEGGSITEATNTAQVMGENTVGGILGLGEEGVELAAARNTGPVIGGDSTGGVAGLHNGSIAASSNSGSVTGNDYVGGLSGLGGAGPISNSSNSGHVIGRDYVGGLTGLITTGQITTSFNAGTVNGETYVGGIVSISQGNIQASYNVGRVEGTSEVGGITSILSGEATIVHAFSAGAVVATEYASAIVSIYTPPERLVGAHFDSTTTGRPESDVGNGWPTTQMFQQATFVGWDFQSVWSIQEGVAYPDLVSNPR